MPKLTAATSVPPATIPQTCPPDADVASIKQSILRHLKCSLARDTSTATLHDWWIATCMMTRDLCLDRFIRTQAVHNEANTRRVYYLSLEYLMGRLLRNNLSNSLLLENTNTALAELGFDLRNLLNEELDMGLGNGGLGRLAACFLDSLATLEYPAIGYGIMYEFGLFRQSFEKNRQVENADNWLPDTNPWPIRRPQFKQNVPLYGYVETCYDDTGNPRSVWHHNQSLLGIPCDIPVVGYGAAGTVNFLRLWESRASNEFDFQLFNEGGYTEAVQQKAVSETISKVLYPNDKTAVGKELRLVQQIFFVSCSLQDLIRRFKRDNSPNGQVAWKVFPEKVAIQLNDTHPAIATAELMRLLLDEELLTWDSAWNLVTQVFSYTNHTLLPEALEKWSVALFERVLPRHLQIIYEINLRFLQLVEERWPGDNARKRNLSLIEESPVKMVRMAHLAVVASHTVNGVAALHTQLLKESLFADFDDLWPNRIQNKTNGITPRRWLRSCNPLLALLVDGKLGPAWTKDLALLQGLEKWADDPAFQGDFMAVKHANKVHLASVIKHLCKGLEVSPHALYDVQIKRLHEYKRQHLNLLHILTLYRRLLANPNLDIVPRVFIFGAKAAPGYDLAKDIIHAINAVASHINTDPRIKNKLKIAFLPDYRVTLAEQIIPAADLSEQISTAGKEASGTGNMKLALNGALTIGTLDGANIEIREEVGAENIFIFGLNIDDIRALSQHGHDPRAFYETDEELREVINWLFSGYFTNDDPNALLAIKRSLLDYGDPFLVLADYRSYLTAQEKVDAAYRDKTRWARMAILNTARSGKFSSDRAIREYARDIWHLSPLPVP